jgi:hypothetical protein
MSKAFRGSGAEPSPYDFVSRARPCPRCGEPLSEDDLNGVVGKAGVSAVARCGGCTLLWAPRIGWFYTVGQNG